MDVVRYLREVAGVDIERATNEGYTPFYAACYLGQVQVVVYLMKEILFCSSVLMNYNHKGYMVSYFFLILLY